MKGKFFSNRKFFKTFNDEARDIRNSAKKLMKVVHEPLQRAQSVPRYGRASSMQPTYSR
jgi:hypothetical protein